MSKNRFASLKNVKQDQEEQQKTPKSPAPPVAELKHSESTDLSLIANQSPRSANKVGRPSGKRSSAEFQQVTAYIRRQTYKKVGLRLFEREPRGEFSELVEELLQKWLEN